MMTFFKLQGMGEVNPWPIMAYIVITHVTNRNATATDLLKIMKLKVREIRIMMVRKYGLMILFFKKMGIEAGYEEIKRLRLGNRVKK